MSVLKCEIKEELREESEIDLEKFKNNEDTEENRPNINVLKRLDCCSRCILLYSGVTSTDGIIDNFLNAEEKLEFKNQSCSPQRKKIRRSICSSCLGIFEDKMLEEFASQIPQEKLLEYTISSFTVIVMLPKCIWIRIHSILIYLKEQSVLHMDLEKLEKQIEMNFKKVYRTLLIDTIVRRLEIPYEGNSNFSFEFKLNYFKEDEELKNLKSKGEIASFLSKSDDKAFKTKFAVPPIEPMNSPTVSVNIITSPLYLGGRYLKFVRNIGQTPWFINGKAMAETSVQEIIFNSINKVLGCNYHMIFSSSGREDADVRMLGQGRPFYIQITNPKSYNITFEQFREIEEDILKSEKVGVIKLQIVSQSSLKKIKQGEKLKNKCYSAICITGLDAKNAISIINGHGSGLKVAQKTPIRVLHRRSLDVRDKMIYSMEATKVEGHPELFLLNLLTQAGTYVKEFVHGDFNRTIPNLSQLIGQPIDIIALDVLDVYMEWP